MIHTDNSEKYEKEIAKYYENQTKWTFMRNMEKLFTYLSFISIGLFYLLFIIYVYEKLVHKDTIIVFRSMMGAIVFSFIFAGIMMLLEVKRFSMSTRARLWNMYKKCKERGFELEDIEIWLDVDKVYSHLIFKNDEGKTNIGFIRLDEFSVTYKDVAKPQIKLDEYEIIMPNTKNRKKQYISCE